MIAFLRLALVVARRELIIYLRSPIALVVAAAFLVLEGISFASLVSALADPARPAPLGAVLEGHFGGTLLHWTLELTVLAALAARLAEERRTGTWEALVTAPVPEGAAVLGSWLAALALWATLWLICLAHVAILVALAPAGASIDAGPIATAYAGEVLIGAAGLALAFAAGAWSAQPMVATISGFAVLSGWLLFGELGELAPSLVADSPGLAATLDRLGPRRVLAALARGEVHWDAVGAMIALVVGGLRVATAIGGAGRRRRGTVTAGALEGILLGAALALAAVLVGRAVAPWDVTAARRNSLEPATRDILARVREPVTATVLAPAVDANRPLFAEVERVLDRMTRAQPALRVVPFDAARDRGAVPELAALAAVAETELVRSGAVILTYGQRVRAIALRDLEGSDPDAPAGSFEHVRVEAGLGQALAELLDETPIRVCATTGHGELPPGTAIDSGGFDGAETWAPVAARLAVDGIAVDTTDVVAGVPATCRVVVIAGPTIAFTPAESAAISHYLDRGGNVLLALPAVSAEAHSGVTGLEPVLAAWGVSTPRAWAIDPSLAIDLPLAVRVIDGHADHPITRGFARRRATVWQRARPLVLTRADDALVTTTDAGWGETTLVPPPRRDGGADLAGPLVLASAHQRGTGKLVVLGSAAAMTTAEAARGWGVDLLAARAISWLTGRTMPPAAPEKDGDRVRLVMSSSSRRAVAALTVAGVPLAALALLWLAGRRRRRRP